MRDKVELNATLYLPHNPNGRTEDTPLVFTLTPYISDSYHPPPTATFSLRST